MAIFERLSDEGGQITLGWAAERVFYVRFDGTISVVQPLHISSRGGRSLQATKMLRCLGESPCSQQVASAQWHRLVKLSTSPGPLLCHMVHWSARRRADVMPPIKRS